MIAPIVVAWVGLALVAGGGVTSKRGRVSTDGVGAADATTADPVEGVHGNVAAAVATGEP